MKKQERLAQIAINETALVASITRASFYEFVKEFWDVVITEKPVWNWHIKYLCDEAQKIAERVFKGETKAYDLIVNISPGTTKSTIFSVMFPAWVWTRMPHARFICGSHTFELGQDLSRKCRDIVISEDRSDGRPGYKQCFPEVVLKEDQNTKNYFMTTKRGSRKSVTVSGSSPIGFHAHFLIVDDPIDPQGARSEADIKNANDWMTETLPTRKVDKNVTPTILVMQRLHQNDPSGAWLAKESPDVKHICLPADCTEYQVKPTALRKRYINGLMDPKRITREFLTIQKIAHGEYHVAGQYGQSPVPPGGGMFKVNRIVVDIPPHNGIKRRVRYWDKAGTAGGGAYTVGALLGIAYDGTIWVLDIVRGQWAVDEREKTIKETARRDGKRVIIGLEQEPGSGGKDSATMTLKALRGYRVKIDKPSGNDNSKILRAEPFSDQVNGGNVKLAKGYWNKPYLDEMEFFPYSTYKDQVDASSGAFNLMVNSRMTAGAF